MLKIIRFQNAILPFLNQNQPFLNYMLKVPEAALDLHHENTEKRIQRVAHSRN
jgi:hypothetical protein